MLKIRMQRIGRINMPSYRIIVVEHTESTKTGNFTDIVGTYNPRSKERKLDEGKIKHWLSVGAQPSATVHNMLVSVGILKGKKINVLPAFKAPASPEATQGESQAAPVEPVKEEAPAEAVAPEAGAAAPAVEEAKEETKAEAPAEAKTE
ncbi:30S ribosomal protein S16 [Candidatus Kaiserbacteria bacterium RIFCSPHIGHO2_02_FULL_55_25]|uniref:Small ribosomal subunit protein bS16 n=1 Tax=Candidatus Kaiserbacteria bacterium RIFCSPHIGHO2_02_FULL_55_25 TaxID=1798498 RepID=A0A1F6E8K4_9BACT|nr:MAG: 30S ribosomal protein S16 [Candidatus Kaiserbacteria bacterium RIFCSPHIGHO2_01_FULL_55_79]OGG70019.1 MAG: 30S ribosomal protein S16 [Candidatus Kaiserbacteria bacterium RIFCSPHIGHO2_02_FULL_55_25]OGG77414.1 MAG: 30S ribosomal protein S16 [Candidatus Kaiserbacteria bacterium RIFCSPHIGHO2_12_FULL_55_13]OGG82861.1 MAG: 30S ribosomal protein S16 [Candidatus Kaiserbacteria bacterium RIFCSPLOWO2_01_FULL_55_25]